MIIFLFLYFFYYYLINNFYKITPRINTGKSYDDWILLNMAVATQQTRHVFIEIYFIIINKL